MVVLRIEPVDLRMLGKSPTNELYLQFCFLLFILRQGLDKLSR